ncbi:Lysophosphatidic acid:oleoyl-CoA acyltransferase 1 [Savitreella phatthalungensis]
MEKFTRWRDAGTGIAPFLPVPGPDLTLVSAVPRVLLSVVKTILLAVYLGVFLLVDGVSEVVGVGVVFWLRAYWARHVLMVAGYLRIPVSYDGRKVLHPGGGDVVVVNRSSPLDVLLVVWLYPSAVFVTCDRELRWRGRSAGGMMLDSFRVGYPEKGEASLEAIGRKYRGRVLVTFPEATTTNNRGILAFTPTNIQEAYVTSIKYTNPPSTTTPIPASYAHFIWALTSVPSHELRIRASPHRLPAGAQADALARYARVPRTALGIEEKMTFVQAWRRR